MPALPTTNIITYNVPNGTSINKNNSSSTAPSDVTVGGTFAVTYTYSDGALTGAAVSAVNLSLAGTGSTYDNAFGDFTSYSGSDNEGVKITIDKDDDEPTGIFSFEFRSFNENTTATDDATDFNKIKFSFQDDAALSAIATDDVGPRSLDFIKLEAAYDTKEIKGINRDNDVKDTATPRDTLTAACYTKGTLIMTATGEVAVEDLSVGDQVMTVSGTLEPVIWLGNSTINCERQLNKDKAYPVRIVKDAFGANLPKRDLFVSPDHSLYLDGVMIPAYCLINGSTITQEMTETLVTYYHVELPKHNAILAEGLPAESYLETSEANRNFFKDTTTSTSSTTSNVTNMDVQYPACPEGTPAWKHIWDTQGYAKLTQDGPILEAVKARLVGRAQELNATAAQVELKSQLQAA